jgi:hypothetical protein
LSEYVQDVVSKIPSIEKHLNEVVEKSELSPEHKQVYAKFSSDFFVDKITINSMSGNIEQLAESLILSMSLKDKSQEQRVSSLFKRLRGAPDGKWVKAHVAVASLDKTRSFLVVVRRNNTNCDLITTELLIPEKSDREMFSVNVKSVDERSSKINSKNLNMDDVVLLKLEINAFVALSVSKQTSKYALEAAAVIAGIDAGLDLYKKAADVFKTTIDSQIVKTITDRGFSYFKSSSSAMVTERLPLNDGAISAYRNVISGGSINMPAKYAKDVVDITRLAQFTPKTGWGSDDFLFATNQLGDAKWITFSHAHNADGKSINFMIAATTGSFRLAPDIEIVETRRSIAGGIFNDNKLTRNKIPKTLTQGDTEKLKIFFRVMMYKKLAEVQRVADKTGDNPKKK